MAARFDFDRARVIAATWPLCEVLNAYMEQARRNALEQYSTSTLVWAALAPHQKKKTKPPALPAILKDND